jgi:hypothetical protein
VSFGSRALQSSQLGSVVEWCACCSAARVATRSRHRESTPGLGVFSIDTHEVAGAREALRGFHGVTSRANRVAMRNQSARSAFRRYPEFLVWQGRWGSRRGGNVAAGFQPDSTSVGRFRAVVESDDIIARADQPASAAGNRRGCRCIQPIGYEA